MASVTWYANKDARIADGPSGNVGAGASDYNPWGSYSGYNYRTLLGFGYSFAGMTSIDSATLYIKMSGQNYVAFGSSPSIFLDLITAAWSEGSSSSLSGSNAVVYPGPAASATNRVSKNTGAVEGAWVAIGITNMMRQALASGSFQGIRIIAQSTSAADVGEIYAREAGSAYRPYIAITYSTNAVPTAPTLVSPVAGAITTDDTPDLTFTPHDAQNDPHVSYRYQVSKVSDFSTLFEDQTVAGPFPDDINIVRTMVTPLDRGFTYYWRVQTTDVIGTGPFSAAQTFVYNALPAIADIDRPYGGAKHVAPIHNLGQLSTPLTPKPSFTFTPRAAGAITEYEVRVAGVGTDTVAGSFTSGVSITHLFSFALTNLTSYTVEFRAKTAAEGYGPWSTVQTFAVKYAEAIVERSMVGASGIVASTTGVVGTTAILYRQATGVSGAGAGAWGTSVPATVAAFLNILFRTSSSGTAPAQPKIGTFKLSYISAILLPYSWTFTGNWNLDMNVRRYGTQSLFLSPISATTKTAYQDITNLAPDTDYAFSVWVLVKNWVAGSVGIAMTDVGVTDPASAFASVYIGRNTVGWERLVGTFKTGPSQTEARFMLVGTSALVAPTTINYDAAMLSEGLVAPVWTPALVGSPVVIDAQGIFVDGAAGGLLRIAGPTTALRDVVEIGGANSGVRFGGDTLLTSPSDGLLAADGLTLARLSDIPAPYVHPDTPGGEYGGPTKTGIGTTIVIVPLTVGGRVNASGLYVVGAGEAGAYSITGFCNATTLGSGTTNLRMFIHINGVNSGGSAWQSVTVNGAGIACHVLLQLAVGDTVGIYIQTNTAGSGMACAPTLRLFRVAPALS